MTTAEKKPDPILLARADVAEYLSTIPTKEQIEAFVAKFEPVDVPRLRAMALRAGKGVAALAAAAKKRIIAETILGVGEAWVDPDTKDAYVYRGEEGEWVVADPYGLRSALEDIKRGDGVTPMLAKSDLDRVCVPTFKVSHTVANELAKRDPKIREVIDDYRVRTLSAPDLREVPK